MFERLKELVEEVTENSGITEGMTMESNLITDVALDSLQFINLILALEDEYEFEIGFEELDIDEIATVGKLIEYMEGNKK
ncbi:phosphopantetheine-binding protein [Hungatella sp.]|uniref:phosphopantetheine-binding protein n=1 Tax=Hungatella sp. TaxID=2613924 RepID=UPI002A82BCEA|nr:phosphopantetheine-binding protein [Hungatella sp.]